MEVLAYASAESLNPFITGAPSTVITDGWQIRKHKVSWHGTDLDSTPKRLPGALPRGKTPINLYHS